MVVMWPLIVLLGIFVFAVGTVVGSFLNVCIYRIPWQKSVIWPGSRCPGCMHEIAGRDNVPIVGWLALRGECRTCGMRISPRYPLIEGLSHAMLAGSGTGNDLDSLAVIALWGAFGVYFAVRGFSWEGSRSPGRKRRARLPTLWLPLG